MDKKTPSSKEHFLNSLKWLLDNGRYSDYIFHSNVPMNKETFIELCTSLIDSDLHQLLIWALYSNRKQTFLLDIIEPVFLELLISAAEHDELENIILKTVEYLS